MAMFTLNKFKKKITATFLVLFLALAVSAQAEEFNYTLGAGYAPQTLSGGESGTTEPYFVASPGFIISLGRRLGQRVRFRMDYLNATIYSDSSATSIFQFNSEKPFRVSGFSSQRVSAALQYFLLNGRHRINPLIGFGVGIDFWKFQDPQTGLTLDTLSDKNVPTKFDAQELVLTTFAGLEFALGSRVAITLEGRADYLSSLGAEFADIVNSSRPRLALSLATRLQVSFGSTTKKEHWNSDKTWSQTAPTLPSRSGRAARDSDGDGVDDDLDKCPSTVVGAIVNSLGCAMDTDGDGVFDGLDDCPRTPPGALGAVDIYGCPIDSDFDGIADFMDACPASPVGAHVDAKGCLIDSDNDGVADGLDDCPQTASGLLVDERGCVDVSLFAQVMILNINYVSGSFEVDKKSKLKLKQLALMLKAAPNVHLEIIGYTDNIGAAKVNRTLSEKRARRVRDYLKGLGISTKRMTVRGRGETNFIADNSTSEGRQKNRRIEILFQRK